MTLTSYGSFIQAAQEGRMRDVARYHEALPAISPDRACVKCGVVGATRRLVDGGEDARGEWKEVPEYWWLGWLFPRTSRYYERGAWVPKERIVRECSCGFMWAELPLDAEPTK